jgi:putative methionine-R-sulfoxide reductase with GAF domain
MNFFPPLRAQEDVDYPLLKKKIDTLLSNQDKIIKKLDNISKEVKKIKIRVSRIRR